MPEKNTPLSPATRLAAQIAEATARLAAQIAEATANAKKEAQEQIEAAAAELAAARDGFVRAEARLVLAAATVREFQDLIGGVPRDDLILTQAEVDTHNNELYVDDRLQEMVFGHSYNSCPDVPD